MIEKIVFIDDDAICSFLNETLVTEMGIAKEIVTLPNAEEALEYFKHHYNSKSAAEQTFPDLIFLDISLPGMDGFEFLETLDKHKYINQSLFLIIMLSASLNPSYWKKSALLQNQIAAHFTKPLAKADIEELLAAVQSNK